MIIWEADCPERVKGIIAPYLPQESCVIENVDIADNSIEVTCFIIEREEYTTFIVPCVGIGEICGII